ncbi:ATP-dependent RNA helicase, partial [mine drainage metagenome]
DRERGPAWVRGLLGSPSEEIVICGTPHSEGALRRLAEYAGVEIEVCHTTRKTPLEVASDPIPLDRVPDGSIVVAFSRMDVLTLARHLRDRGRPIATIYGAMPPELRRAESRRFRTGEATVMLATDAVGMGLNIPAEYVIFSTASKFDGRIDRILEPEEVRQIGGRAGRFGLHDRG